MNEPLLLVGCPVHRREWVIEHWFDHVMAASTEAGITPEFVFVVDKRDPTWSAIRDYCKTNKLTVHPVFTFERSLEPIERRWSMKERLERMVTLRNLLLDEVRALSPSAFLSLDSDILIHPQGIKRLTQALGTYDLVGGKAYMTPWPIRGAISYAILNNGGVTRTDADYGPFPVDIVMAVKLMAPEAYWVNYTYERRGEDFGYCIAAKKAGVKIGFDGTVCSKHIMNKEDLDRHDQRCGF